MKREKKQGESDKRTPRKILRRSRLQNYKDRLVCRSHVLQGRMRACGEIPIPRRPQKHILMEAYGLQSCHVRSSTFCVGGFIRGRTVFRQRKALSAITVAVRDGAIIVFTNQAAGVGGGARAACTYVSRGIAVRDGAKVPTNQAAGVGISRRTRTCAACNCTDRSRGIAVRDGVAI